MMRTPVLFVLVLVAFAGCSAGGTADRSAARDTLSRGAKDSAIARSKLPGAHAVGKAQDAAAAANARAAQLDSIQ